MEICWDNPFDVNEKVAIQASFVATDEVKNVAGYLATVITTLV